MHSLKIGIIGTGPAALMAGTLLAENGHKVHFFDQSKAPSRKFLVAGHGGFNLTHSEPIEQFKTRYDCELLKMSVQNFTNVDFIEFLKKIGIETYVGSSGKIFPVKGTKPITVLNAWLEHLKDQGAIFHLEHRLTDFRSGSISVEHKGSEQSFSFDRILFALGGGSWSRTGSDGKWLDLFRVKGIQCKTLGTSNSGFELKNYTAQFVGAVVKNCKVFSDDVEKYGDAVLTEYGIEGAPVYALNAEFRKGKKIFIDLKPDLDSEKIRVRLASGSKRAVVLKALKLSKGAIGLLKSYLTKEEFLNDDRLVDAIKRFELPTGGTRPLDEVISSVGGIDRSVLTDHFELRKFPGMYCVGEMVDWDAPTGGYLIQGCVSSGVMAARSILDQS